MPEIQPVVSSRTAAQHQPVSLAGPAQMPDPTHWYRGQSASQWQVLFLDSGAWKGTVTLLHGCPTLYGLLEEQQLHSLSSVSHKHVHVACWDIVSDIDEEIFSAS